ncbi:hypothetical protein BDW68DRAFT_191538 [Aspergillus falconensis]
MAHEKPSVRLAFLGCGHIGKALLGAILPSVAQPDSPVSEITVAVSRQESQAQLQHIYHDTAAPVHFVYNGNVQTAKQADAVILAFPPEEIRAILTAPGMKEALEDKIIISILARTPRAEIERLVQSNPGRSDCSPVRDVQIIRAMPSIGTAAREAATFIAKLEGPAVQSKGMEITTWMFNSVGKVFHVSDDHFDTITGMCAFSNALIATAIKSIALRTSAEGVPLEQAIVISAQCIRGSLALILSGTSLEQLQASLSAPGSITGQAIQGLQDRQLEVFIEPTLSVSLNRAREYDTE